MESRRQVRRSFIDAPLGNHPGRNIRFEVLRDSAEFYRARLSPAPSSHRRITASNYKTVQLQIGRCKNGCHLDSIFIQVLLWDVVFWKLARAHFSLIRIVGLLNTRDRSCLEDVPFLDQFINAF